ncbi:hypothetical protein OG365_08995 [Streptomyces sp. NBC_00853]|nr:hypothetical protein OG365_08995 [Streptomyces sp. NBC_00853]
MDSDDGSWWVIFAVAAGVTVVLGALFLSVVAAIVLGIGRVRRRSGR